MKRTKLLLFLLVGTFVPVSMYGQQVSTDVLGRFPSSVSAQVLKVLSKVSLNVEKQQKLAFLYQKKDSLLAAAYQSKATPQAITALQATIKHEFAAILSPAELQQYNAEKTALKEETFIRGRLDALNTIKPLSEVQQTRLYTTFMQACKEPNRKGSYTGIFDKIMRRELKDPVYFGPVDHALINQIAKQETFSAMQELLVKYKLDRTAIEKLRPIVFAEEREYAEVKVQKYPAITSDSLRKSIKEKYATQINQVLLAGGYLSGTSTFGRVLTYKKQLNLSATQIERLVARDTELSRLKKENKSKNGGSQLNEKEFTAKYLPGILGNEKYLIFLGTKYREEATKRAMTDWTEAKRLALYTGTDSSSVIRQFTNYHLNKLIVKNRQDIDKTMEKAMLTDIASKMPPVMKQLVAARKNPNRGETLQHNLVW